MIAHVTSFSRKRSWARRFAMQALYQWQLTGQNLHTIETQFQEEQELYRSDNDYFRELLYEAASRIHAINEVLVPYLDRPLEQVDPVERAILWLSGYELLYRQDIPFRVIINEGVELAKKFGAEQGHRFINGVLDKAARQLRAEELGE